MSNCGRPLGVPGTCGRPGISATPPQRPLGARIGPQRCWWRHCEPRVVPDVAAEVGRPDAPSGAAGPRMVVACDRAQDRRVPRLSLQRGTWSASTTDQDSNQNRGRLASGSRRTRDTAQARRARDAIDRSRVTRRQGMLRDLPPPPLTNTGFSNIERQCCPWVGVARAFAMGRDRRGRRGR
jgi:hypothetical protein